MVTLGLYGGLKRTPKASATFPNKVNKHFVQLLPDLSLHGHQTWLAVSFDLCPKNASYDIVMRIQTWEIWRPNVPVSVLHQIYFIQL